MFRRKLKHLLIEDEKNDYEEERILNIQTSRTGILDYLPEAFFEQKPFKLRILEKAPTKD